MPRTTSNKDHFNEVCKDLEQIRRELNLKKCNTLSSYTTILTRYNQINTQTEEIKYYTSEHPSAKNKLRSLESKIAILRMNLNLKFGIQQEYEFVDGENESIRSEEKAEDYKKQEFTKEMKLREQKISQYTKLLKQLEIKRDEFHTRYPDDSCDDVSNAYGAACQLVNILNGYTESYKKQDINLTQFKENSSRVIQSRRNGVLGEHRGVKELLINLLLVIGTLGIGYAFAALFTQSFTPIKCNTDTVNRLNETKKKLDEVEAINVIGF